MSHQPQAAIAEMPDLACANPLIGDRAALDRRWRRDGYWYFRAVLDRDAVATFRAPVLDALKGLGLVGAEHEEPVLDAADLAAFPEPTHAGYCALPGLAGSRRWEHFLAEPPVAAFFTDLLGRPPSWVPVAELRVHPPREALTGGLLTYPHQDGFYNEGYRCITAWFPLWPMDRATGGLALAAGMHKGGYLHDADCPPRFPIPPGAIAWEKWRTADYQPGDVVLFDRHLPHSGLRNRSSDRFRVSFDVRCVLAGDPAPVVGTIVSASADSIAVRTEAGAVARYRFDERSFCRALGADSGKRLDARDLAEVYRPGQEVMLTVEGDCVRLLREPKY